MIRKYVLAWFPLVILAIVNGTIRELGYKPLTGDLPAHWLSTFTFIGMLGIYLMVIGRRWAIESSRQAWIIGTIWLCMTVCFEFGFGHYIMQHPWETLLHDYNLLDGRLWVLALAATFAGPRVVCLWRSRRLASLM